MRKSVPSHRRYRFSIVLTRSPQPTNAQSAVRSARSFVLVSLLFPTNTLDLFIGIILQVQNEPVQSIINNHHYRHHGHRLDHTRRQPAEESAHAFRPLNEPQRLPDALLRVQHLLSRLHEIDRRDGRTGQHPAHRPRDEVLEDRRCSERVRGGAKSLVGCPVNRGKENVSD